MNLRLQFWLRAMDAANALERAAPTVPERLQSEGPCSLACRG